MWTKENMSTFFKCDLQVDDMCEDFNVIILVYNDKLIIVMVKDVKMYLMERFIKMRDKVSRYHREIYLKIMYILGKVRNKNSQYTLEWAKDA